MRSHIERDRDLNDAVQLLYSALIFLPHGTPAYDFVIDGVRHLTAEMQRLEAPILADVAGECSACGAELDDVTTHDDYDCPASPDFPWPNESQRIGMPN